MSLNPVSELGIKLGTMSKEQEDIKDAINPNEETAQRQYSMTDNIVIEQLPLVVKRRDISTSSIWGIGVWDEDVWNETYGAGFILGNLTAGVLGSNSLGDPGTTPEVALVYNDNNTYKEYFLVDLFEDTLNTTATWGDGELSFSSSEEVAQSLAIAYSQDDPQTYVRATLTAEGTDLDNGDYYLSADGGTTWESVTNGLSHEFTTTGTDLRFKIDNLAGEGGPGWPTVFGEWGAIYTPAAFTITKLTVRYEVS